MTRGIAVTGLILNLVLVTRGAPPAAKQSAAKEPAAKPEEKLRPSPLWIVGNSGTLHFSRPVSLIPYYGRDWLCMGFSIVSAREVSSVTVSTTGLGGVRVQVDPNGSDCPDQPPAGSLASVTLQRLRDPVHLRLFVPLSLVPAPGDEADGKVLAQVEGYERTEAPIKVKQGATSPVSTAMGWLLGIGIPALLAYWAARGTEKRAAQAKQRDEAEAARRKRQDEMEAYIYTNRKKLEDYFRIHLKNLRDLHTGEDYDEQLLASLADRDYFNLPQEDRVLLIVSLRRRPRQTGRAERRLAEIFPEWSEYILSGSKV